MPSSERHVLQHFREDVWTFTHACESLITDAKFLTSEERAVIFAYMTDLQAQLRSVERSRMGSRAGNYRQDQH
jgi:hypothetical protein